ncbi:MAG: hypothetical protein KDD25_08790 [Bdellovibrionales bacterium]|nr:hypothetical protein [Bdellovibrionales bacterium]
MEFSDISQDVIKLDFKPVKPPFPNDIAYVVEGVQLSAFGSNQGQFRSESLEDFFAHLYPIVTTSEWARIWAILLNDYVKHPESKKIWERLSPQRMQSTDGVKTLEALLKTPVAFQDWVSEKDVVVNELHPLKWAQTQKLDLFEDEILAITRGSRQDGTQTLEWLVDLKSSGIDVPPPSDLDFSAWKSKIKSLRFPRTSKSDNERGEALKKFKWGPDIRARWVRNGDSAGIEVRFTANNPSDFEKQLVKLKAQQDDIAKIVWKKD